MKKKLSIFLLLFLLSQGVNLAYSYNMDNLIAENSNTTQISKNKEKTAGIGALIGIRNEKLLVINPVDKSPAKKAGLKPLDEILEIDGISTKNMTIDEAVDKIKGDEGTKVHLLIKRENKPDKIYTITRKNTIKVLQKESENKELKLIISEADKEFKQIEKIVKSGADLNAVDDNGNTLLTEACGVNVADILLHLDDMGININVKNEENFANVKKMCNIIMNNKLKIIKYLVENGADVNAKDKYGTTPLMNASEYGKYEIVKYLIENGADVNAKNEWGKTALSVAKEKGYEDIVKYLTEKGAKSENP